MAEFKNYIVVYPNKSIQVFCNIIGKDCFEDGSKMFQVDLHESIENIRHFIYYDFICNMKQEDCKYKIKQIW